MNLRDILEKYTLKIVIFSFTKWRNDKPIAERFVEDFIVWPMPPHATTDANEVLKFFKFRKKKIFFKSHLKHIEKWKKIPTFTKFFFLINKNFRNVEWNYFFLIH